jgi:pyrimidine deaminase RibD-like protein
MNIKNIPSFFRLAKNISKMSSHKYPMGSVIIISGHPVSVGYNQTKGHPQTKGWQKGLHAEIHAIKCSDVKDFRGAKIFVYREDRNGNLAMARPCENCLNELKRLGFKWMYYSTKEYPYWNVERIEK